MPTKPPWPPLAALFALCCACGTGTAPGDESPGSESGSETSLGTDTDSDGTTEALECAPVSVPVLAGPGAQQLERLASRAEIPGLADQPTAHGQVLSNLHAFDGRLHLGYGDYNENTGPIAMHAWDPAAQLFVDLGVLPGEEVRGLFAAHGSLYGPAIDHDGHQESGGVYRLDCGAQAWSVETPIEGAVHVYDLAAQGENLYAGTGSLTGAPALLMVSDDRGESWTELLRHESPPDGFSRFYYSGATPELLFVAGREHSQADERFAFVRRGAGAFEPIEDPPTGALRAVVLGEEMLIAERTSAPGFGVHIASWRIEGQLLVPAQPWPEIEGGGQPLNWTRQLADDNGPERVLVMMSSPDGGVSVHRSEDLSVGAEGWELLASIPAQEGESFVSFELLNNDLYLGTRSGSLWISRELEASP